ncbi:hypothetical protein EAI_06028 [Harpegnathos saltator]|uniref:Uncharacterized protein n=1 Tax=Harpegnathos saltator TaxID=610380 RepID=E2C747_HARSA|nr:hypothetical protein EAI_06028 [Harpegnathos saltator]
MFATRVKYCYMKINLTQRGDTKHNDKTSFRSGMGFNQDFNLSGDKIVLSGLDIILNPSISWMTYLFLSNTLATW